MAGEPDGKLNRRRLRVTFTVRRRIRGPTAAPSLDSLGDTVEAVHAVGHLEVEGLEALLQLLQALLEDVEKRPTGGDLRPPAPPEPHLRSLT